MATTLILSTRALHGCGSLAALALSTLGGVGIWSVVVALPAIQAEFGVTRAAASFPYTLTMLGFGVGGIMMGRLPTAMAFDCRWSVRPAHWQSATSRRACRRAC